MSARNLNKDWVALNGVSFVSQNNERTFKANDSGIAKKNRYSDIMPYKDTRVILKARCSTSNCCSTAFCSKESLESTYINACYVDSPFEAGDQKVIAAQGPLPNTIGSFWCMVAEQNATFIITTCKLKEMGRVKCEKFWPDKGSSLETKVAGLTVQCIESKELVKDKQIGSVLVQRTFLLSDKATGHE